MLRDRLPDPQDEEGTSMVEVMVGLAMGMVVLAGLAMLLIVVVRGNARISARSEASDNARVAMTRIMEELHSGCALAATAPVQKESTKEMLIFKHGTYGAATSPTAAPKKTEIEYSAGTLWERTEGSQPRILLSNVSPPTSEESEGKIFRYASAESQFNDVKLSEEHALLTITVKVAFKASPKSEPVADAGAATEISNTANLRLTPPTYRGEKAKPCE
jgi:hypothetical protein